MADTACGLTKAEVIDRLVMTYGGETNLKKLNAVHQLWKMQIVASDTEGKDYRKILLPHHLLVELTYPSRTEKRLISKDSGYRSRDGSRFRPANQLQRDAMRLQLMRLYSPLILRQSIANLEFSDDQHFCVLSMIIPGLRVDYLVNKETWRIEKVAGTMEVNGNEMQFLTEYADFRMVEGVLVHHQENKYVGEINTARLNLLEIKFNTRLRREDFLTHDTI